jgi:hypothetical protein
MILIQKYESFISYILQMVLYGVGTLCEDFSYATCLCDSKNLI